MLDQQTVERLAQRLDDAERSKSLITAFTREYPDLTIEDAYAIQRAWAAALPRPHRQGAQDRPDLEGDAECRRHFRAGLRRAVRGYVLSGCIGDPVRALPRAPYRGRTG